MSVPPDGSFVEVHENLFGFQIFFQAPRTKLAPKAGLLVAAPRRFDIGGLHVIDPNDSGTQRLNDAKRFVYVAGPDGGSETVWRVVGDSDRVGFAVERDHRGDRAENFFSRDARAVFDVVENCRLEVV